MPNARSERLSGAQRMSQTLRRLVDRKRSSPVSADRIVRSSLPLPMALPSDTYSMRSPSGDHVILDGAPLYRVVTGAGGTSTLPVSRSISPR